MNYFCHFTMKNLPYIAKLQRPTIALKMNFGTRGQMEQRLVMTPPIGGSEAEVADHARSQTLDQRVISSDTLEAVRAYVSSEDRKAPYSDRQIHDYLVKDGYDLSRADVALARSQLGLGTSEQRKNQYRGN